MNIKDSLQHRAQELHVSLPKLVQHYAMERFLYRLSLSPYAGKFYLKGGMLLMGMGAGAARTTMDIDFLGRIANTPDSVVKAVRKLKAASFQKKGAVEIPPRDLAEVVAEIFRWLEPVMRDEQYRSWQPGWGWN